MTEPFDAQACQVWIDAIERDGAPPGVVGALRGLVEAEARRRLIPGPEGFVALVAGEEISEGCDTQLGIDGRVYGCWAIQTKPPMLFQADRHFMPGDRIDYFPALEIAR